jgi:hypothetical protein
MKQSVKILELLGGQLFDLEVQPQICIVRCSVRTYAVKSSILAEVFVIFRSLSKAMPEQYLDYTTTVSFQIRSNSTVILPSNDIQKALLNNDGHHQASTISLKLLHCMVYRGADKFLAFPIFLFAVQPKDFFSWMG